MASMNAKMLCNVTQSQAFRLYLMFIVWTLILSDNAESAGQENAFDEDQISHLHGKRWLTCLGHSVTCGATLCMSNLTCR